MSKCGVCHKPRRTGTGSQARLLTETGDLRTVIACATCAKRGALVIAPAPPTFTMIESDDADVVKVLRALAKHFKSNAVAYEMTWRGARDLHRVDDSPLPETMRVTVDVWESAASVAEAWANERAARKVDDAPEHSSRVR